MEQGVEHLRANNNGSTGVAPKQDAIEFQQIVYNTICTGSEDQFRSLLQKCFLDQCEEDTLLILGTCRYIEYITLYRRLLSLENLNEISGDDKLVAGRVAVVLGLVYYRGEGIPQDYPLARRYFDIGMHLNQATAYFMSAFMAERGHGEKNGLSNPQRVAECFQKINRNELEQAIVTVPADIPVVTEQNIQAGFAAVEMEPLPQQHTYPAVRVVVASQHLKAMRELESSENSSSEDALSGIQAHVIAAAENLYRAHQDYLRAGIFKGQRKLVATAMAKLYEDRRLAFERCEKIEEEAESNEDSPLDTLQEIAFYAQYYYGLIDPSIYEELCASTNHNPEIVITLILQDKVSSSRAKMKRILALLPIDQLGRLFSDNLEAFKTLAFLAYQAQNDTLVLAGCGELQHEADLVKEMNDYQAVADAVLKRLQQSDQTFLGGNYQRQRLQEQYEYTRAIREHAEVMFPDCYQQMVRQGFVGFARAIRLLMNSLRVSHGFVAPGDWFKPTILRTLLTGCYLKFIEEADFNALMVGILRLIPPEERSLKPSQMLDNHLDESDKYDFDNKTLVETVDNLANFYRLLSEANITLPAALQSLNKGQLFGLFDRVLFEWEEEHDDRVVAARQFLKELFHLYQEHRRWLSIVKKAITEYQSDAYRPSQINFFSSTYGKDKEYAKQLRKADELLSACERAIFDRLALLKIIHDYFKKVSAHPESMSFAWVLMKMMPGFAGDMNIQKFYDEFSKYYKREESKVKVVKKLPNAEVELLSRLCAQFFDNDLEPPMEVSQEFLAFLISSSLVEEAFPGEQKTHLIYAVYLYYGLSEERFKQLLEFKPVQEFIEKKFPAAKGYDIKVYNALIFSEVRKTRGFLVDRLRHFNTYCVKIIDAKELSGSVPLSFESYYEKAGLNRAISKAWEMRKKVPKGLFSTLTAVRSKDPEEDFYRSHLTLSLSIKSEHHFRHCLRELFLYFKNAEGQLLNESYSHFLMECMVTQLDRREKNGLFRAKYDGWKAENPDLDHLRLEFCAELRKRYFSNASVKVKESTTELPQGPTSW